MFTCTTLESEERRVWNLISRLPFDFGFTVSDRTLCRCYLYHLAIGQIGIYEDAPILHLKPDQLPLSPQSWSDRLNVIFSTNQAVYIVTDGVFQIPEDEWKHVGRTPQGPMFCDDRMHFYMRRFCYRCPSISRIDAYILDCFTPSLPPYGAVNYQLHHNYTVIKIHNPKIFTTRHVQTVRIPNGPEGPPPSLLWDPIRGYPSR